MKLFCMLALLATSALAAPTLENRLEHLLRQLVEAEKKTLFDKKDPTPIKHPIDRTKALLADNEELAGTITSEADIQDVSAIIQETMAIFFEAVPPENKATVLARFVEGYVDHLVYREKDNMLKISAEILNNSKRSSRKVIGAVTLGLRNPSMFTSEEIADKFEGSGPYVFNINDAVSHFIVDPADELVKDMYRLAYADGEEYLGGLFYDIEFIRTDNSDRFGDRNISKNVMKVAHALNTYLEDPVVATSQDSLEALGARIMEYGEHEQSLDAKDAPSVRGLTPEEEEIWATVYAAFKTINKDLSHSVRRVAKYLTKDKMENLSNELSLYIVNVLFPDSHVLEDVIEDEER